MGFIEAGIHLAKSRFKCLGLTLVDAVLLLHTGRSTDRMKLRRERYACCCRFEQLNRSSIKASVATCEQVIVLQ